MIRNFAVLLLLLGLAGIFIHLMQGYIPATELNQSAHYYAAHSAEDLGAANIVTAIIVTYRGLDTLGEVTVLFLAATIIGMVLAAVFSAAMSTLSSSLNSSASALVNDWFRANQSNNVDEDTKDNPSNMSLLRVTQWLTAIFGVLQIGIAIGVQEVESVVGSALAIAGFSAGLLLGVFLLGILVQQAGQTSALAGLLCGTIVLVIVRFVLPGKVWLGYEWQLLAWPWFPVVGSVTTFTVGTLISLIFPIARIQK